MRDLPGIVPKSQAGFLDEARCLFEKLGNLPEARIEADEIFETMGDAADRARRRLIPGVERLFPGTGGLGELSRRGQDLAVLA